MLMMVVISIDLLLLHMIVCIGWHLDCEEQPRTQPPPAAQHLGLHQRHI